jgi:hypothetical protein
LAAADTGIDDPCIWQYMLVESFAIGKAVNLCCHPALIAEKGARKNKKHSGASKHATEHNESSS